MLNVYIMNKEFLILILGLGRLFLTILDWSKCLPLIWKYVHLKMEFLIFVDNIITFWLPIKCRVKRHFFYTTQFEDSSVGLLYFDIICKVVH